MEKMESPRNLLLETQLSQRLLPATNPNTKGPPQNCSESINTAVKEGKVRSSSDNGSFIKYGNKKEHGKAPDSHLSLLDILNDDELNKNMSAKSAPEAHVAFSVEGLGRIAAETPTRTPTHRERAPVAAFCSPSKPGKRMKSFFKLQPASDDLKTELDTVMQDFEVPLDRLPPAVSYCSEDISLDKPNFLEHDRFNMMHVDPTSKDPSLEDVDDSSFWQIKNSRTYNFAFNDIGASHRFGSGENYKAGRLLRKQVDYDAEDFDWGRHPAEDDALNVNIPSLSDTERRFSIASSSDETSLSPPAMHRRTCVSSKNVKISAGKTNHHEKLCRRLDKEFDLRKHPIEEMFQDLNEGLRDINYRDERCLSPPVRHTRTCESLKNVKFSASKSNHQEKLRRRLDKEYDLRSHPVERPFQDFNEYLCENDVKDGGGLRAFSNNRKSKTYDCFGKSSGCKAYDLFSLDEDIEGSKLKSSRTGAGDVNFDFKLSEDVDIDEPGDSFPHLSGGFSGNRSAGSQSHRCKRDSIIQPGLTHRSKNTSRHPFGLFDHGSPERCLRDDRFSHEVADRNSLKDDHDECGFLSSCTKTSEKEASNKSGLDDKGSSTRMDVPSHVLDHCLEASNRVLSQDREASSPAEEAFSATQEVSPKPECFVSKKLDQTDTSPPSCQNRDEVNCTQETIGGAQMDIGKNPTDPSYQVMLQSYVLQLLCVQKVLMDSSKEYIEKKT